MTEGKLVMLGTRGGPRLSAGTSWPTSMVLEVSGRPYIIDAGLGVTRQFVEAGYDLRDVHTIVITHHHSDHNLELGPLLHTTWTASPFREIFVYGPPGLNRCLDGFFEAHGFDIGIRMRDEGQADIRKMVRPQEYTEGRVFADDRVQVTALRVSHPPVYHCYALKFQLGSKSVVFSADTNCFPPLARFAKGADILVHEVMHGEGVRRMCERLAAVKPDLYRHMVAGHTFAEDVGRIARAADVSHLVLNHYTPSDDPDLTPEDFRALVRQTWAGRLTAPTDLTAIPL